MSNKTWRVGRLAMAIGLLVPTLAQAAPVDHPPTPPNTPLSAPPLMAAGCTEDSYEPNPQTAPRSVAAGRIDSLAVCGNDDWWRVSVVPGMRVHLRTEFSHAMGDVDMTLHNAVGGMQVGISEGVTDFEDIWYTATVAEDLLLRVYGYDGVSNTYALVVEVDDYSTTCANDTFEPNNGSVSGLVGEYLASSAPASPATGRLCMADEDWFSIDVAAGEGFDFGVSFDPTLSPVSLALYGSVGAMPLQDVHPTSDDAMVMLNRSDAGGRYWVRVYTTTPGGFNDYDFSLARYAPGLEQSGVVAGTVQYEDQLRGQEVVIGAPPTRWLPARNVPVELVRSIDMRVLASTLTDETGAYAMPFIHRASGDVFVRVSATLHGNGYDMRIIQREDNGIVHESQVGPLSRLTRDSLGRYQADFRFAVDSALGGAFNVVDRSLDAFRFVERLRPWSGVDLTIVWERGRPHACTSCFDTDTIYLGGGFDDPDEYDDSVVLHEFGHFFVYTMSYDDSPGGNHDGTRTDPLVAYGEGLATWFAMVVQGNPIYVDTNNDGFVNQDFEWAPYEETHGTATGTLTGMVSEYLVVALIWDLFDGVSAEGHDSLALGAEGVMRVLFDYMPTVGSRNQGIAGADMADFLTGVRMMFPEHSRQLDELMAFYEFPGGSLVDSSPSMYPDKDVTQINGLR